MLERARRRLPDVEFREGTLDRLPLAGGTVDLVVCALALCHLPDLPPAFAEFARVLRPGGHLVVSDAHLWSGTSSSTPAPQPVARFPGRVQLHEPGLVGDGEELARVQS